LTNDSFSTQSFAATLGMILGTGCTKNQVIDHSKSNRFQIFH